MTSDYERIEAEMAALRAWAEAQGRSLTDEERQQLNEMSIERATAYRVWQAERNRANAGRIVTGHQIFRLADGRRQWKHWTLVGGAVILLAFFRVQRYSDRQSAASDTFISTYSLDRQSLSPMETHLLDMLPDHNSLPDGFTVEWEQSRTIEDVASDGDSFESHLNRLTEWGFAGSITRHYELSDVLRAEGSRDLFELSVELYKYGSVNDATDAAEFERDNWLRWMNDDDAFDYVNQEHGDVLEVDEHFGDSTLAVQTPDATFGAGHFQVYLWVVDGPYLYEFWTVTDQPIIPEALMDLVRDTLSQN